MLLIPRLMVDTWGTRNWVLHDGRLAKPLIVLTETEMQDFIREVGIQNERQQERVREEMEKEEERVEAEVRIRLKDQQQSVLLHRFACRNRHCSETFFSHQARRRHEKMKHGLPKT